MWHERELAQGIGLMIRTTAADQQALAGPAKFLRIVELIEQELVAAAP